jgi:hypothetical protein
MVKEDKQNIKYARAFIPARIHTESFEVSSLKNKYNNNILEHLVNPDDYPNTREFVKVQAEWDRLRNQSGDNTFKNKYGDTVDEINNYLYDNFDREKLGYDADLDQDPPVNLKSGDCTKKALKGFNNIDADYRMQHFMRKFCQATCIRTDKMNIGKEHKNMFDNRFQYILLQKNSLEYGFVDMKNFIDLLENPVYTEPSFETTFSGILSFFNTLYIITEKGKSTLSRFRKDFKFWGRYKNFCGIYTWKRDDDPRKCTLTFKQNGSTDIINVFGIDIPENLDDSIFGPKATIIVVGLYKYETISELVKNEYENYKNKIATIDDKNKGYIQKLYEKKENTELKIYTKNVKDGVKLEEREKKQAKKKAEKEEKIRIKEEEKKYKEEEMELNRYLKQIIKENNNEIKEKNKEYLKLLNENRVKKIKSNIEKNTKNKNEADSSRSRKAALDKKKREMKKKLIKEEKIKQKRQQELEKKEIEETLTADELKELKKFREKYENRFNELKNKKPLTAEETTELNKLTNAIKSRDRRIELLKKEFKKTITDKEKEELTTLLSERDKRKQRILRRKLKLINRKNFKKDRKRQEVLEKKEVEETLSASELKELQKFRQKFENKFKELKNKKPLTDDETKELNILDKLIKLRDRRIELLKKEFKKTITDKEKEELKELITGHIKRRKRRIRRRRDAKFLQRESELAKKKLDGSITEKELKELNFLIKKRTFRERRRELIKKKLKGIITKEEEKELSGMYEKMKLWKDKKDKRKKKRKLKQKLGRFSNLNTRIYLKKSKNKRILSGSGLIKLIIFIVVCIYVGSYIMEYYYNK